MTKVAEDNSFAIGNTPLVKIKRITEGAKAKRVLAKIEGRNPAYSVKCRIGSSMIWDAEKRGELGAGKEIIEPTSGNTGIALAYVCAARGHPISITMPESMSMERRKVLTAFGCKIILTPAASGMKGAVAKATEIAESDDKWFMPQQFKNPANPDIHYKTTGPEIWEDTEGDIDVLVSGVGTGGTISGVSWYIKKGQGKDLTSIAVEPIESPIITQKRAGADLQPGPHKIQGIGAGFIPDTLDMDMVDRVELVDSETAIEYARRLTREEGILSGISCGAAMAVADRVARMDEFEGKSIVVVLPDAGERYLTGALFEGIFDESGLQI